MHDYFGALVSGNGQSKEFEIVVLDENPTNFGRNEMVKPRTYDHERDLLKSAHRMLMAV